MKRIEKFLAFFMLVFAVGFNLWLYRLEPTATVDPNDNAFQFALVDRTNTVWDFAAGQCSKNFPTFPICFFSYLSDHWVNNWAQGYNLPFYYSHIPQITIVATWRLLTVFTRAIPLFTYYHWIIYLLLCLFPIPVFLALRVIKLPWLVAGLGAVIATHVSTDGLYGLDPTSYLWRGYGLSSQLFAQLPISLAIAYSFSFFSLLPRETNWKKFTGTLFFSIIPVKENPTGIPLFRTFWLAVFFIFATTAGHLGIGIITIMSLAVLAFARPLLRFMEQQPLKEIWTDLLHSFIAMAALAGTSIFFLSYWIIPVLLGNDFHNASFWDPVWKFNSYGWYEITKNLLNGALFDFGRKQFFTVLVLLGALRSCLVFGINGKNNPPAQIQGTPNAKLSASAGGPGTNYFPFALLFLFWLAMYFGRTTWGGLIDLIPGMKEFHISRFIVGLHAAGFFLAPLGIWWLHELLLALFRHFVKGVKPGSLPDWLVGLGMYAAIVAFFFPPIYRQTMSYNFHNDRLIRQANENHDKVRESETALFAAIRRQPPGRVFAGRGGWWGKDFRVAETPYYMNLSTYGIPTSLWLPETWSPNSDIEQYFSEDKEYTYDLFNLRYVAAPPGQKPESFWKPIDSNPDWKLYEVATSGYFTVGTHAAIVTADKLSYANVERLWIQSEYPVKKLFPQLIFGKLDSVRDNPLPRFGMIDESTYRTLDGKTFNLFAASPVYMGPEPNLKLAGKEEVQSDMIYKTTVEVGQNCTQCIVVLKQSFHPDWRAWVDGKAVKPFIAFPVFLAVPLTSPGTHTVEFAYLPSTLKVVLLVLEVIVGLSLIILYLKTLPRFRKPRQ